MRELDVHCCAMGRREQSRPVGEQKHNEVVDRGGRRQVEDELCFGHSLYVRLDLSKGGVLVS